MLYGVLYEVLHERVYELCSNHHDDEVRVKNLRLYRHTWKVTRLCSIVFSCRLLSS